MLSLRTQLRCSLRAIGVCVTMLAAGLVRAAETSSPDAPLQQITNSADFLRVVQNWVSQNHVVLWIGYLAVAAVASFAIYRTRNSDFAKTMQRNVGHEVLSNPRLALLGLTSLALTLASGWTTWDGMTNFTGTPVLSFMITLGIQGVMLVAAWLIGESFAIGLAGKGTGADQTPGAKLADFVLAVMSIAMLAAIVFFATMALTSHGAITAIDTLLRRRKSELAVPIPQEQMRILIALSVSGLLTLLMVTQKDVFEPYFRGLKTILRSLPLWLMFLACMGTSVFFSFDSLFSTIFPANERERAAQLRTTNQIAGIVADLGTTIAKRQADAVDSLFTSAQWTEYNTRINDILAIARSSPDKIAEQARKQLEVTQAQRASIEERKTSAQTQQVRLDKRKEELIGDIAKLKEEVPPVAAEVDRLKNEIFQKDSAILAKKAETQAEAGGVGGTLKAGQGPIWQQRKKEMDDLSKLKAILVNQLNDRTAQLKDERGKLVAAESELAQIDGEIGTLKGAMDVADQQIATTGEAKPAGSLSATTQTIATNGFSSLEDAFAQFRQHPERTNFDAVQQQCAALLSVFDKVPELKSATEAKGARCDPSVVAEPVSRILALNDGLAAYNARCAKPDSLPQSTVDDLLNFGQQCVQTSGLGGQDTIALRSQINSIGLNRDDKAHRFVVSWNAFLDGNRLAYLALGVAIALDGLVFMAGLFGANATSSPLVRLPSASRRSAADLEATMYAALRPDIYGRAKLVIGALHPIQPHDGFVSEIRLADFDREAGTAIRSVLSMAGQFGAVEPDRSRSDVYLVRGALTEFLSKACERELRANPGVQKAAEAARVEEAERHQKSERDRQAALEEERKLNSLDQSESREMERRAKALEPLLTAALIPDRITDKEALFYQATKVLANMRPTADRAGFSSEIEFGAPHPDDTLLRSVLNVAAARKAVQKDNVASTEIYLLRPEFTLALSAVRVRAYEDWQRNSNRTSLFGWARKGRTLALASETSEPAGNGQFAISDLTRFEPPPAAASATPTGARVIPLGHQNTAAGSAKFSQPTLLRPAHPQTTPYFEEVKGGLKPVDSKMLDLILQRGWAIQLESGLNRLKAIAEFAPVIAKADHGSSQWLHDVEIANSSAFESTSASDRAETDRAVQCLGRLTYLRSALKSAPAQANNRALLQAIGGLLDDNPQSVTELETAVANIEAANRPRTARADMN